MNITKTSRIAKGESTLLQKATSASLFGLLVATVISFPTAQCHPHSPSAAFAISMSASGMKNSHEKSSKKSKAIPSESKAKVNTNAEIKQYSRRDALISAASISGLTAGFPLQSNAELPKAETVDLAAIKAAQSQGGISTSFGGSSTSNVKGITPIKDPNPLLTVKGGLNGKSPIKIPRVGYSLYKTSPDVAARSTALALRAGVRHFDVGTLYNTNKEVAIPLQKYLNVGMGGMSDYYSSEKPELLSFLDKVKEDGDQHALSTLSGGLQLSFAPPPDGSAGRRGRREGLFISHKVSNAEQSTKRVDVQRAVKSQISTLGTQYLDMVSLHSPLTDQDRRRESYAALLELREAGFVKSVGVCNYGIGALTELKEYGFDLPRVNQIELSPFNTHSDVVSWCDDNNIAIGCSAWSKLSGIDGPQTQWAVLSEIAKNKQMTKAQVLVRWSLQKGYICIPRSGAASKVERFAIGENSYGGVNRSSPPDEEGNIKSCILTGEEMAIIDGLNIDYKAGKLGRRDGWDDIDVKGPDWDPTNFI